MKKVGIVFALLIVVLSALLYIKVKEDEASRLGPASGSGVIEAVEVNLSPKLMARLKTVHVEEGDKVKRGQTLVELDCREANAQLQAANAQVEAAKRQAEAAKAKLQATIGAARAAKAGVGAAGAKRKALEANLSLSDRQVKRLRRLEGEGGATQMDLDRAAAKSLELDEQFKGLQAQLSAARGQAFSATAQTEAARAQAEAAQTMITSVQAALLRAQLMVEECTLTAPIDGEVLQRVFEPGELSRPGFPILTLIKLDRVEVTFFIPNRSLGEAAPGNPVTIIADAYPSRRFNGRITRVSKKAEFTPRNVQTKDDRDRLVYAVTVKLKNDDGALLPGMPVDVTIDGAPDVRGD